jgi:hypothetical protein
MANQGEGKVSKPLLKSRSEKFFTQSAVSHFKFEAIPQCTRDGLSQVMPEVAVGHWSATERQTRDDGVSGIKNLLCRTLSETILYA